MKRAINKYYYQKNSVSYLLYFASVETMQKQSTDQQSHIFHPLAIVYLLNMT